MFSPETIIRFIICHTLKNVQTNDRDRFIVSDLKIQFVETLGQKLQF